VKDVSLSLRTLLPLSLFSLLTQGLGHLVLLEMSLALDKYQLPSNKKPYHLDQ
jgi:hypothetical protein